jgi:sterol desaturase/sphingolipid hydroxylase (fatty acid hydroxylase superfamily)
MINKMKALKVLKYVGFGILGIGFVIAVIFVVQALWNWLIPGLFNGPVITFWQTAGLFLLSKILLSGLGPGSHRTYHRRDWKKSFREKYHREVCISDLPDEKA